MYFKSNQRYIDVPISEDTKINKQNESSRVIVSSKSMNDDGKVLFI